MDDLPRRKLMELVGRFGPDVGTDARRCEALLKDLCPQCKREISVLVSAAKESVPAELLGSSGEMPKQVLISRLSRRLHENFGVEENLARWAVESWAVALGIASPKELRFPFKCPACGAVGSIGSRFAGQTVQCPKCKASVGISADGRKTSIGGSDGPPDQSPRMKASMETVSPHISTITVGMTPPPGGDKDASLVKARSILNSKPSWSRANRSRLMAVGLVVLAIVAALGIWRGFGRRGEDTPALRQDTAAVRETVHNIKADTADIKDGTNKTAGAVEQLDQKLDGPQLQIREKIGAKKLGPEYENTAFHRDYQDNYLHQGGNLNVLMLEYRRYVASSPQNAMYHYLLARLYERADKLDDARAEAEAGMKADPNYFWNRRLLLYIVPPQKFDLQEYLALESLYYRITPQEQAMFSSNDPAAIARAFREITERFRDDLTIGEDLKKRHLCWHLFAALSKISYPGGSAFKSLIGKETVSMRNTLKMKVLDVRTGEDAIGLIRELEPVTKEGKDIALTKSAAFTASIAFPPVALQLSISAANGNIRTSGIQNRDFQLRAHASRPAEDLVKELIGKMGEVDPNLWMPISQYPVDVRFLNPRDFWVYFFGLPAVPWRDGEAKLLMGYSVENKSPKVFVEDVLVLHSDPAKNLLKAPVDASDILTTFDQLLKMGSDALKGFKITSPMEGKITRCFQDTADLALLGFSDMNCTLVFGKRAERAREAVNAAVELGLKWPPRDSIDAMTGAAENSWIRFTGTVVQRDSGRIFVIPDSVTRTK
jgi:predicted RNA-binding Zn-ribbon protein involved in translation (DUF1610 family)